MTDNVIGKLGSVANLMTDGNGVSIFISWSAPFSLDVTDVDPDIWYTVLIYNVTGDENPTAVPCTNCNSIVETNYVYVPVYPSPCQEYAFEIIPMNEAGQGESQPLPGYTMRGDFIPVLWI